jgi:hypothetical protein
VSNPLQETGRDELVERLLAPGDIDRAHFVAGPDSATPAQL